MTTPVDSSNFIFNSFFPATLKQSTYTCSYSNLRHLAKKLSSEGGTKTDFSSCRERTSGVLHPLQPLFFHRAPPVLVSLCPGRPRCASNSVYFGLNFSFPFFDRRRLSREECLKFSHLVGRRRRGIESQGKKTFFFSLSSLSHTFSFILFIYSGAEVGHVRAREKKEKEKLFVIDLQPAFFLPPPSQLDSAAFGSQEEEEEAWTRILSPF